MKSACTDFRAQLTAAIECGPRDARVMGTFTPLGWHEHLISCDACRALLEREEALEDLLGSLPDPDLPAHLVQRVLAALRGSGRKRGALDALLDLDPAPVVPEGLGARVLAGVTEREREAALDRLLDRAREVPIPDGLARRVLSGVARERTAAGRPRAWRSAWRSPALRLAASLLAVVSLAGLVWTYAFKGRSQAELDIAHNGTSTSSAAPVDEGLLAALDVLESWDVLEGALLDPELSAFALFDTEDEVLLEFLEVEHEEGQGKGEGG